MNNLFVVFHACANNIKGQTKVDLGIQQQVSDLVFGAYPKAALCSIPGELGYKTHFNMRINSDHLDDSVAAVKRFAGYQSAVIVTMQEEMARAASDADIPVITLGLEEDYGTSHYRASSVEELANLIPSFARPLKQRENAPA